MSQDRFRHTIPILRMFDAALARDFYLRFLGFSEVFEHRFAPDAPLYLAVRLGACELHLSEHHGDATPGSAVRIVMSGLADYHQEISARGHTGARPGLEDQPYGWREMTVLDPFGNRLIFAEPLEPADL